MSSSHSPPVTDASTLLQDDPSSSSASISTSSQSSRTLRREDLAEITDFMTASAPPFEERPLNHRGEAEAFYQSLAGRVAPIGVEATGNDHWFHKLVSELGHELPVGDAARFVLRLRASSGRTSSLSPGERV